MLLNRGQREYLACKNIKLNHVTIILKDSFSQQLDE